MIKYKRNLLLSILTVFAFGAVIGISYAYFSIKTIGNETASTSLIKTASREIQYTDLTILENAKMEPGWNESKTIIVENLGTKTLTYNMVWQTITNNLSRKQDLVISLTCSSNIAENTCSGLSQTQVSNTGTNMPIINNIPIAVAEKHTYVVTIKYLLQSEDQSIDMNKTVNGKLGVIE